MNWRRIWSGAVVAGLILFVFTVFGEGLRFFWIALSHRLALLLTSMYLFQDLLIGFILSWLYALARPRLGPGPKTALVMGTLAWALWWMPLTASRIALHWPPGVLFTQLALGFVQCCLATYFAGWQYIEKAP